MKIEPLIFPEKEWWQAKGKTFGNKKIYKETVQTSYGRCIHGSTDKHNYSVFVAENPITKAIKHKLYIVNNLTGKGKDNWLKSFLRFFNKDKCYKEIRSQAK